jgi:HAD superfamily hydrolase (TIGR01459 family)
MSHAITVLPGITLLASSFRGVLLDAYGVFWGGNEIGLFDGAKDAMEKLVASGKIVGILSNSTQLVSKEIDKFRQRGLIQGKHFHFLVTSGEVTRYFFLYEKPPFNNTRKTFYLFGEPHPKYFSHKAIFEGSDYREVDEVKDADFLFISIPNKNGEDQTNPELFREEIEKIKAHNLPMVCANPDLTAIEGLPPRPVVRQGSIAKMYEKIGGRVFYIGKPDSRVYAMAMNRFLEYGLKSPLEILMFGDTPETDIRGARSFGMPSALVTHTGIMAHRISHNQSTLRDLPASDIPEYFVERFVDDTKF